VNHFCCTETHKSYGFSFAAHTTPQLFRDFLAPADHENGTPLAMEPFPLTRRCF
jgi:hypothetical protein